jgi:hypothetical protein
MMLGLQLRISSPTPPVGTGESTTGSLDGAAEGAPGGVSEAERARRFFPLLLVLFIGSGCAALIYEIVWFQLLQLVIGSSAVSIGVLLGTFMGGMCIGSLALARFVSTRRHPLRVYAVLELGIGASGILMLLAMPLVAVAQWRSEAAANPVIALPRSAGCGAR